MWTKPPPEVSCAIGLAWLSYEQLCALAEVSSSVESFYRGAVAGGVFGLVFGPENARHSERYIIVS